MSVIYGPIWDKLTEKQRGTRVRSAYDEEYASRLRLEVCTFCGLEMTFPGVYWNGSTTDVWLHPPCVLAWTMRLMRDVHEIELMGHSVTRHPFETPA